jgi:hypothetical protein
VVIVRRGWPLLAQSGHRTVYFVRGGNSQVFVKKTRQRQSRYFISVLTGLRLRSIQISALDWFCPLVALAGQEGAALRHERC